MWKVDLGAGTAVYPPAAVDNMLFIGNFRGEIKIVRLPDGKVLGKKRLGSAITGTPVVDGDVVYVALTNSKKDFIAYDFRQAEERWNLKIGSIESSPLLLDSKFYIGTLDGMIYCVDAKTGVVDWRYSASSESKKRLIRTSPATNGNLIVFSCDDGTVIGILKDGTVSWKARAGRGVTASPAIFGEWVYICSADSSVYSLSVRSGTIEWRKKLSASIFSAPAVNGNNLVAGCVDGAVWCLDRRNGEKVWVRPTGGVIASAPVISGSLVYTGNLSGELNAISLESGELADTRIFKGRIKSSPLVYKQYLFLIVESRTLVGLRGTVQ